MMVEAEERRVEVEEHLENDYQLRWRNNLVGHIKQVLVHQVKDVNEMVLFWTVFGIVYRK